MRLARRDVVIAFASAAVGAGAVIALSALKHCPSYEECVVREMRGQDSTMLDLVTQLCKQRHPPKQQG